MRLLRLLTEWIINLFKHYAKQSLQVMNFDSMLCINLSLIHHLVKFILTKSIVLVGVMILQCEPLLCVDNLVQHSNFWIKIILRTISWTLTVNILGFDRWYLNSLVMNKEWLKIRTSNDALVSIWNESSLLSSSDSGIFKWEDEQ